MVRTLSVTSRVAGTIHFVVADKFIDFVARFVPPDFLSLTSLVQMVQATNCENLSPGTVNAIVKQLRELQERPAEGISVSHHSTGRTHHRC